MYSWQVGNLPHVGYFSANANEFLAALQNLMTLAATSPTAILCAEAVTWRCHRQLIADALVARGWEVRHILGRRSIRPHRLTEFAKVVEGNVISPGQTLF
jgi:uncharacterized protein (DUF488 family)